jgi:pSer/pThr/pTyr-binding forkhead associated (FHA) protein
MRIVVLDEDMQSYNFDSDLLTFGRADDNLLQLDVPGVSRYHGKVEKVGADYFIYDLGSTNGIYLNGEKVNGSSVLHEGDIARLHEMKIQFFELDKKVEKSGIVFSEVEEETVYVSSNKVHEADNPLGKTAFYQPIDEEKELEKDVDVKDLAEYLKNNRIFQKNKPVEKSDKEVKKVDKSEKNTKKSSNWIFYVIVFCVVVSIFSLFVIFVVKKDGADSSNSLGNANSNAVQQKAPDLYLSYTKEIIVDDNIYRYALRIERDKAWLSVDDVKSQLSVGPIALQLDELDLSRLRQSVIDSNFLKNSDKNVVKFENNAERDYRELMVLFDGQLKQMKVVNSDIPDAFKDVEDALSLYIQSCELPFLTLSTEDLQARALDSFRLAEDLFANYEANYGNLKKAIYEYNLVKEYLRGFSPEPAERIKAVKRLEQAEKIRKERFQTLRAEYDSFVHKKDLAAARNVVALILELYGEETKEYEYFRERLIKIDELLRASNRKGRKK